MLYCYVVFVAAGTGSGLSRLTAYSYTLMARACVPCCLTLVVIPLSHRPSLNPLLLIHLPTSPSTCQDAKECAITCMGYCSLHVQLSVDRAHLPYPLSPSLPVSTPEIWIMIRGLVSWQCSVLHAVQLYIHFATIRLRL